MGALWGWYFLLGMKAVVSEVGLGRLCSWGRGGPLSSQAHTQQFFLFLHLAGLFGKKAQMRFGATPVTCYPRWKGCSRQDISMSLKLGNGHPAVGHHAGLFLGQGVGGIQLAPYTSCLQRGYPTCSNLRGPNSFHISLAWGLKCYH